MTPDSEVAADVAIVIPAAPLDDVVTLATEQERLEGWIQREVEKGAPQPGLYPANDENNAHYMAYVRRNSA